ncbi:hypothetical protein WDR10_11225 [Kurthia gibsonii]|uniref:hypothetical protein n=1 Tax=Kurthia gibsonii TaxID=33946 RepID=UPI0030D62153
MGKLFNQLTEAKQELKVAFDNRQMYRKELEGVQKESTADAGKALHIAERETALRTFVEGYNDDMVTAANKVEVAEQALDTWLQEEEKKNMEQYNAAVEEVAAIETLAKELQQRAQALYGVKQQLFNISHTVNNVANDLSETRAADWKSRSEIMGKHADHIARRNSQVVESIQIKMN